MKKQLSPREINGMLLKKCTVKFMHELLVLLYLSYYFNCRFYCSEYSNWCDPCKMHNALRVCFGSVYSTTIFVGAVKYFIIKATCLLCILKTINFFPNFLSLQRIELPNLLDRYHFQH